MRSEDFSAPFSQIAPYYDQLMSFVNYPAWVSYIEKILSANNIHEREILDVACGTGVCLEIWHKKGYRIIGLDSAPAMLDICRGRFPAQALDNGGIELVVADMRDFSLPVKVPIATCLYDSLNYLLTEGDLIRCFKSVNAALADGGLFIFDMNTVHALRDEWGNQTFFRQDGKIHSTWSNTFDQGTRISSLRLTLTIQNNGQEISLREFHQERAYSLDEIVDMLTAAGFEYSIYRHLCFTPASENDMRIMGVAKKPRRR